MRLLRKMGKMKFSGGKVTTSQSSGSMDMLFYILRYQLKVSKHWGLASGGKSWDIFESVQNIWLVWNVDGVFIIWQTAYLITFKHSVTFTCVLGLYGHQKGPCWMTIWHCMISENRVRKCFKKCMTSFFLKSSSVIRSYCIKNIDLTCIINQS